MRLARLLSILAVAGLVLGGCGARALTGSQLRTTATRICGVAARLADEIPSPATPAASAAFIRRGIDVFSPQLSELRKLQVSSASSRTYATALGAIAAELSAMRSALRTLNAGGDSTNTIKRLQRRLEPQELRANLAWQTLEIPACQSG
jgi:hypothetical protein